MNTSVRKITLILSFLTCMLGFQNIVNARTIVVHVTTHDADRVTNALLFSKHTCQFLPDADVSTVRILFSNDGALNAIKNLLHPKNRIATLPDDDPKTANHLIRQLLGLKPSFPDLRCTIQMAVTGPGLKKFGKKASDLFRGIKVGGPKPTTDPAKVQVPAFVSTPEIEGEPIVVVDW